MKPLEERLRERIDALRHENALLKDENHALRRRVPRSEVKAPVYTCRYCGVPAFEENACAACADLPWLDPFAETSA